MLVGLGLTAAFNRAVNPYCLFATDWVKSESKPETFSHLRIVKAAQVRHLQPASIILGSSRAETGLDPAHPKWSSLPVYNLGLSNAGLYEVQRYFQHACEVGTVRDAVILLDYTAFLEGGTTAPDFTEERLAVTADGSLPPGLPWKDYLVSLFSSDAFMGSLGTLLQWGADKRYLNDGSRDARTEEARVHNKGGAAIAFRAYEKRALPALASSVPPIFGDFEMSCFEKILSIARSGDIDLRLVIAPMHGRYQEMLVMTGHWPSYEEWKRRLTALVEAESNQTNAPPFPLFDFGVYHDLTTDKVPESGLAPYYFEASHFTKRLGNEILNLVLASSESRPAVSQGGFGHLLEPASLEAHLEAIRIHQAGYQRTNEDELQSLRDLAGNQSPSPRATSP